ncbi:leucine-rich repeat protein [Tanacetum coccineum]
MNILMDVACALDYLHNCCQTTIVHGDVKPSNILLDDDMVAHVGYFGLARYLGMDSNQNSSTGVKGIVGYAPPEYGLGSEMTVNHVISNAIDGDAIVLQSTEAMYENGRMFDCSCEDWSICSVDFPNTTIDIENVVH